MKHKEEWLRMLMKAGFRIIDVFYSGFWNTPYVNYVPSILQHLLIRVPSVILFYLGFRFPDVGEGLCIVAEKKVF
jgi:hypothetical protein